MKKKKIVHEAYNKIEEHKAMEQVNKNALKKQKKSSKSDETREQQ
jgi:hypothetical protein